MVMSEYAKPLPNVADPTNAPYWAAAKTHKLVMQRCPMCSQVRFPPRNVCPNCQAVSDNWVEIRPTGVLLSYATYERAFDNRFRQDIPYSVGYIHLDDGPRVMGTILGEPRTFVIGAPVQAVFDDVTPDVTLVRWKMSA
jgi:uncharacterized OB-fold protein